MSQVLTLLTWNLWFGDLERSRRLEAALARVRQEEPDVIAFQEVLPETLAQLAATPWVQGGYHLSDPGGASLERYGTVVLTRDRPLAVHHLALPSRMGRKLVAVDLEVPGGPLRVGGMHLESLRSTPARILQLERIFPFLAAAPAGVLMGDMNFDAGDPEERALPGDVVDVWPALHPGDPGATRDTERNLMAAAFASEPRCRRIDRVFFRGGTSGWRPASIRILGDAPVSPGGSLFASDHFGLVCRLERTGP